MAGHFVALALNWIAGIQPPPTLLNPDPQARNTVDRELVRFHGLPIGAGEAAVRTAFPSTTATLRS